MTAEVVARKIYEELIARYGVLKRIHTDMGTQFESELIRELCELYGIVKTETRPYHHESVGAVERLNRTLTNMLRVKTVGRFDKNWENFILEILVAIRNMQSCPTVHSLSNIKDVGDVVRPSENQIGETSKKLYSNNPVVGKLDKRFRRCNESKLKACEKIYGVDKFQKLNEGVKFKKTYCYCKRGEVENDFMVECDSCKDWFHGECVKIVKRKVKKVERKESRVKRQVRVPQKFDSYEMEKISNKGNLRCIRERKVVVKNNLLDIDDLQTIKSYDNFILDDSEFTLNIHYDKYNLNNVASTMPIWFIPISDGLNNNSGTVNRSTPNRMDYIYNYNMIVTLNANTARNRYPAPNLKECLEFLSDQDRWKTAFSTEFGDKLYQFKVMPQGLSNAPSSCQQMMYQILKNIDNVTVYLDDIIASHPIKQHRKDLKCVLGIAKCWINCQPKNVGRYEPRENDFGKRSRCDIHRIIEPDFGDEMLDTVIGDQEYKDYMNTGLAILCIKNKDTTSASRANESQESRELRKRHNLDFKG
ncbi:hypothetical protein A3Q56_07381 [Intoshia linei]|uniref:Integrase catalytic domain-containing protein n=1 Tax=Intoshia linei TaxID=1819745 RepID=A0A177ASD2_9BILA|nr:hypothetical protein A3Q56_07381 [Intoshia linei]